MTWGIPNEYHATFNGEGRERIELYESASKFQQTLSTSTGAGVGFGKWFSMSVEVTDVRETTREKKYQVSTVQQKFRTYHLKVIPDGKDIRPSNIFKAALDSLPENYDKVKYMNVVKKWGTHSLKEVELGGRAESKTSITSSFVSTRGEQGTKVEASAEYFWLKVLELIFILFLILFSRFMESMKDIQEHTMQNTLKIQLLIQL